MRSAKNKGTYALTLFAALIVFAAMGSFGAHASSLSDSSLNFTNTLLNDSGSYVGGNKINLNNADVSVCKGKSTVDNAVKNYQCSYVCKSTDTDCQPVIQQAVDYVVNNNLSTIYIAPGTYYLNKEITKWGDNVRVSGADVNRTILKINESYWSVNFGHNYVWGYNGSSTSTNWEISHMTIDGSNGTYVTCFTRGGGILPNDGDYFHDLLIKDVGYFGFYNDPLNDAIFERIDFQGNSGCDRIGGGDWKRVMIKDITFTGNISGDTNIDVLHFHDGIIQNIRQIGCSNNNNLSIYMEPAVNTTIRDVDICGHVAIQSNDGYPSNPTWSNSRHVRLYNIKAKTVVIINSDSTKSGDEFGDIVAENIFTTGFNQYGDFGVKLFVNAPNNYSFINNFVFRDVYCILNPTSNTVVTGLGTFNPGCIWISQGYNMSNVNIDNVYVENNNASATAYGVVAGVSFNSGTSVRNLSVTHVSGKNLMQHTSVKSVLDFKTDSPRWMVNSTAGNTFAPTYITENLVVSNGTIFANNVTDPGKWLMYWNGTCVVIKNLVSNSTLGAC